MASLENLCTRGIYLENGMKALQGGIKDCIEQYLLSTHQNIIHITGFISKHIKKIEIRNSSGGTESKKINPCEEIQISIYLSFPEESIPRLRVGMGIDDSMGRRVTTVATYHSDFAIDEAHGELVLQCRIPSLPLSPGEYSLKVALGNQFSDFETVERAASFEVIQADFYGNGRMPRKHQGPIMTKSIWSKI